MPTKNAKSETEPEATETKPEAALVSSEETVGVGQQRKPKENILQGVVNELPYNGPDVPTDQRKGRFITVKGMKESTVRGLLDKATDVRNAAESNAGKPVTVRRLLVADLGKDGLKFQIWTIPQVKREKNVNGV